MEENYEVESSNIHSKWLDNIYNQFIKIQEMETLALEGCMSLAEFMEIPIERLPIYLPEIEYKNLRFMVRELKLLVDNLSPILKEQSKEYRELLKPVLKRLDDRSLFLSENKKNNIIIELKLNPIFHKTVEYVLDIKTKIIEDDKVMKILYYEKENKKW